MECPRCGHKTGKVAVVVGFVQITTCHCKNCGKGYRVKVLLVPFSIHAFESEIDRLHRKHPGKKPPHVSCALQYLQGKIDAHHASALDKEAGVRRRRADLEEREFLKRALGEDY